MFERLTERARQVVVLAQEEARILRHDYIGTEHILLGLAREEEGLGARVLESLDITVERVRAKVVRNVGSGKEVVSGQIPFTPRAEKVFELALREALSLGHNYIGTEHILLGLVRENEGLGSRVLLDFDADSEKVRDEVLRTLSGPGGRTLDRKGGPVRGQRDPWLDGIVLSDGLLDGSGPVLRALTAELERTRRRSADAGDLLLLLASVPEGLAARALGTLGVDVDALVDAVAQAREVEARSPLRPAGDLLEAAEEVRAEKDAAIESQQFEKAANLRDRQRELHREANSAVSQAQDAVLQELRARLRLEDDAGGSDA